MKNLSILTVTIILSFSVSLESTIQGQSLNHWKQIQSVEDVCLVFPERIDSLLLQINLNTPGLEAVKEAHSQKQPKLACQLLLDYYRKVGERKKLHIKEPQISQAGNLVADLLVENIYTINNQTAQVPYRQDGHINWAFRGPAGDSEWSWVLNRHYHLDTLFQAYMVTGNPVYARTIDLHIKDWIIASLPYTNAKSFSNEMWRGLEVNFRVKQWAKLFYALNNTDYLSPATQLLILSSMPEHAHYLRHYHDGGNWLTMEISALATLATAWPEYKESPNWFQYAVTVMEKHIEDHVYPDGAQKELSSSYHKVSLDNFNLMIDICKSANVPVSDKYGKYIEKMWNYLACTIRPDGYGLLNNDSDLKYNRGIILHAAEQYRREDWKHIATNGKESIRPLEGPSFFFPWAGHLIMRSGYNASAQWAFFDIGPCGIGAHQHYDKLHLSISAYGHDFLVDAGRFSYDGEAGRKFRQPYAVHSVGHNVILIDGKGQASGPSQTKEPLTDKYFKITDHFDYACNSFSQFVDVGGNCEHSRALFYLRGICWVVVDKITTDRPRKIETLWHWHPNCQVNVNDNRTVIGQNEGGFLQIIPAGVTKWSISLIKGQETPSIQGWYSREYNVYEPNTTSIYTTDIQKESTFVWILYPSEKQASDMQAAIISENTDGVIVQVNHPENGQWTLNIPFKDSNKASMRIGEFAVSGFDSAGNSTFTVSEVNGYAGEGQLTLLNNKSNSYPTDSAFAWSPCVNTMVSTNGWRTNDRMGFTVTEIEHDIATALPVAYPNSGGKSFNGEGAILVGNGAAKTFLSELSVGDVLIFCVK